MSLSFSASAGQPLTWCFRRGLGERFIRELIGKMEVILTGLVTLPQEKLQGFRQVTAMVYGADLTVTHTTKRSAPRAPFSDGAVEKQQAQPRGLNTLQVTCMAEQRLEGASPAG